jgi:hypothetical protein
MDLERPHRRVWVALALIGAVVVGFTACTASSGTPQPSPASLTFPQTTVGQSTTGELTITNVAESGNLTIESMGVAGPDAAMFTDRFDDDSSVVVSPGQSTTVPVVFSPTAAGPHQATLRVNHSGSDALSVPLSGTAVAADPGSTPLVASPSSLSFPATTVGQSTSLDMVLRNAASSGSIRISSVAVQGPDAAMFHAQLGVTTLPAGQTVTVPVTFAPIASGSRSATLTATHNGTNSPLTVALSGQATLSQPGSVLYRVDSGGSGLAGSPRWAPDSSAQPSPHVNAAATGNSTSTSGATVNLSDPSVPADTPMEVFQTERWDAPASPDLTYAFPVPNGTPVEVRLYLAETHPPSQAVGERVFDVEVDGTTAFRDVDVFARVGADKGLVLSKPVVSDGTVDLQLVPGVGNPAIKGVEVVTADNEVPPWPAASPSAVDFPEATARQPSSEDVTITNIGTSGTLTVTSTSISGPDEQLFADRFDDGSPVTLDAGESTTFTVVYLPTVAGASSATLSVAHS